MSKIARVKFIRDKEPNIKALPAEKKVLDGALYVATDTGTLWMGISSSSLIQIKDNINTNTTYNLTKSGSTITLRGSDGSTFNVADSNTVYGNATTSAAGLMSAADKAKLDGVSAGSNRVIVDAKLSADSTNPVQNKVIKSALDGKSNTGHKHVKADITDFPTSMPASDVSAWAKAATKPSYSKAEVGLGNVDNTADSAKSVKYAASAGNATKATTANALNVTELKSQNLDDVKTIGLYYGGGSNAVKNKPASVDAFGLEVKKTANGYVVQVLTEGNTNATKTWIRQFNSSAWSAWGYYFDSAHKPSWSDVTGKPSFATVATSGSYNDLSNKPTIPTIPGALKNPNALTISLNGTSQGAYDGSAAKSINITASSVGAAASTHTHSYLPIAGGTMTGKINRGAGGRWIQARNNVIAFGTTANSNSYNPVVGQKTSKGAWTIGNLAGDERLAFSYDTDTNFNADTNSCNTTFLPVGGDSQEIITSATIGSQSVSHANSAGSVAWNNVSGRPSSMPASDVYAWAKASSKPSYSWSEISGKPTIPSVGNGTVTITQNGATKGTFTLNQAGNATIALTDNNTVYSLPTATSSVLGGVKVGSNITNSSGTISLTKANVTAALGYTPPTSDTNTWRPEEVIVSSSKPNASTCKLWIKV